MRPCSRIKSKENNRKNLNNNKTKIYKKLRKKIINIKKTYNNKLI